MDSKVSTRDDREQIQCVLRRFGGPEVIEVERVALPSPGSGEVRARIEATSVQYTDTLIRKGVYPDLKQKPPVVPGYDFVGRIDAVGANAGQWQIGDRVADMTMVGANARFIVRPASDLVRAPDALDAAEATTLVLSWMTAYQALKRHGRVSRGERVLLLGGNGAVGQAGIVLAKIMGAEVYATASERHHELVRKLGAHPLPRDDWHGAVRDLGGMDVIVDGVCADGFRKSYRALRSGGRLVALGFTAPASRDQILPIYAAFMFLGLTKLLPDGRSSTFYGITGDRKKDPAAFREDLEQLFRWLSEGAIEPAVAHRIRLD
ncbi:MAG: medium chain dehydrogenase/reductase family protein, partial [Byssovorax sp.]